MTVRRSKAGFRRQPRRTAVASSEVEILQPHLAGYHGGEVPQELPPGFSPEAQNWISGPGYMEPRSGLSQLGDSSAVFSDAVIGGGPLVDADGSWYAFATSRFTPALMPLSSLSWTPLTSDGSVEAVPSSSSRAYFNHAVIFDGTANDKLVVFTNGRQEPKYFVLNSSAATYSDYTFMYSLMSTCEDLVAFDERLVFFNQMAEDNLPNRVSWTVRGNPRSDSIALGAGFRDLDEMVGRGLGIFTDGTRLVLFSDKEIWLGVPRRDIYAFDFQPIVQELSTINPRTVVRTPLGLIFLGTDLEFYLLQGNQIQPIGPAGQGKSRTQIKLSRELNDPAKAFAYYNPADRRYEFYYRVAGDSFPSRGIFYDLDTGSFWPQKFDSHELSFGYSIPDPASLQGVTWDQVVGTWDDQEIAWDEFTAGGSALKGEAPLVFSSEGTSFRLWSDQTSDDGAAIDVRWRSHGVQTPRHSRFNYDMIEHLFIDYEADSASSASVFFSPDGGANFDSSYAVSFSASSHSAEFVPAEVSGRAPQFEIRLNDGGQPRLTSVEVTSRPAGIYGGGF